MRSTATARIAATVAGAVIAFSSLAGVAQAKLPDRFFGVGLSRDPTPADLTMMQTGGVQTVRLTLDWRSVQPTGPSTFDWTHMDELVGSLASVGIEVVPQFIATPGWLGPTTYTPPVHSAEAKSDWSAFLTAAVQRYGPTGQFWLDNPTIPFTPVTHWQIWNEQNSPGFFEPKPNPKLYTKLLAISSTAIQAVDPDAKIVLGGMFRTTGKKDSIYPWKYLKSLYELKASKYFDVVGTHPYGFNVNDVKAQVKRMSDTIKAHHDSASLWVDEIGWGSAKSGSKFNKGLQGQAKILTQAYDYFTSHATALNLERVYWYTFRDSTPSKDACGFCNSDGLFDKKGNPKPAWTAFTSFAAP